MTAPSLGGRVRNRLLAEVLRRVVPQRHRNDLVRLGSAYGGYVVPMRLPQPDWVCYSVGVGEDVSFDLELIRRVGCTVHAFDPTPRAVAYAERVAAGEPRFVFHPFGVWSEDAEVELFAPRDPAHVSHSIVNLQGTQQAIIAPVRRLRTAMEDLSHDHVDLLKLDIEGAEHAVLASVLDDRVVPAVICVEFDQPTPIGRVLTTIRTVSRAGYDAVAVDRWCVTFVHRGTDD